MTDGKDPALSWPPSFRWEINLGHLAMVVTMLLSLGFGYSQMVGEDAAIRREILYERDKREMQQTNVTEAMRRLETSISDARRELNTSLGEARQQIQRVDNRITDIATGRPGNRGP